MSFCYTSITQYGIDPPTYKVILNQVSPDNKTTQIYLGRVFTRSDKAIEYAKKKAEKMNISYDPSKTEKASLIARMKLIQSLKEPITS